MAAAGGYVTVCVNTGSLLVETADGRRTFDLLASVESLRQAGPVGVWTPRTAAKTGLPVARRICAMRKTDEAIETARAKIHKTGRRKGNHVQPRRCGSHARSSCAQPTRRRSSRRRRCWSGAACARRSNWSFKGFKSIVQLGHLPRYDDESAKARLYGKLLVALLVEKVVRHALAISPWDTTWRQDRTRSL